MLSIDLATTIDDYKERLESHAIMVSQRAPDTCRRGFPGTPKRGNDRISNDVYLNMQRVLENKIFPYKKVNDYDNGDDGSFGNRGGPK